MEKNKAVKNLNKKIPKPTDLGKALDKVIKRIKNHTRASDKPEK